MGIKNKVTARRVAALVAVMGVLVMSSGAAILASAGSAGADPEPKYFVCKYVGTPGVDERLQTGQNPISVSGNAIAEDPVQVGSYFKDGQDRSYVLAEDTGQAEPSVSECPAPQAPEPTSTSATVTFTEPTCDNDNTPSYSATGEGITFALDGTVAPGETVTVTATANDGFVLEGPAVFEHTFAAAATNCSTVSPPEVTPPEVSPPEVTTPGVSAPEVSPPAAEVVAATPTVVHAGLAGTALDTQDGLALLVAGMIMMVIAAGLGTVRPRGGTNQN